MVTDAVNDIAKQGSGLLSTAWNASRGALAIAGVSTAIAVATGGVSLTADATIAAGEALKLTPTDMISTVGQGFSHNLSGLSEIITNILPTPTPV